MRSAGRRIALLVLDADMLRDDEWTPFNYAVRRFHAAIAATSSASCDEHLLVRTAEPRCERNPVCLGDLAGMR